MSRRELDLITEHDRQSFGRNMTYYLTNSERAQRLFRYVDAAFFLSFVVTGLGVTIAYVLLKASYYNPNMKPSTYDPTFLLFATTYTGVFGWAFVAMLLGLIFSSFVDKPYGVSLKQVVFLALRGPFRPAIRDYEDPRRGR